MTRNGRAYRQRLWVPAISGTGGGALPTPTTMEWKRRGPNSSQQGLSNTENWLPTPVAQMKSAEMLPTPQARDHKTASKPGSARMQRKQEQGWSPSLEEALIALPLGPDGTPGLPTPSACVANDGERPETWLARREVVKAKGINGNGMGMPLTIAAQLLSTPTVNDSRNSTLPPSQRGRDSLPGQMLRDDSIPTGAATYLNPSFVEEMQGYPVGWTA